MSTIENNFPQISVALSDENIAPASGQANGAPLPAVEGFDRWIKDFQKYESILVSWFPEELEVLENQSLRQNEMAKVSADTKFKDELDTIEKCL
jgi:hypothetical protein